VRRPRAWAIGLVGLASACGRIGFDGVVPAHPDDGALAVDARVLLDGLVAWYPLDDEFATATARDASGHGHDGHCASCPTTALGRRGERVAAFDGNAQFVSVASAPELRFAAGFTVAAWVAPGRIPSGYDSIVAQPVGAASGNSYQLDIAANDLAEYYDGQDLYSTTMVSPGTWIHIAGTWDGSTKRLYVDGVRENQAASGVVSFDTQSLVLGCDTTTAAQTNFLFGSLADVVLYNRTLSDAEVALLATQ
jgi:hypothetical protein